jgi:hypothetical protein
MMVIQMAGMRIPFLGDMQTLMDGPIDAGRIGVSGVARY